MRSNSRIFSTAALSAAFAIALNAGSTALAGTITNLSPASVSLCAGGTAVQFAYTESDSNASVTATSGNTAIATVTPSSMKGSGHFNVHGQAAGTTSIALTDAGGGSASEPVSVNGPITISPATRTLSFNGSNLTGTQPVTISVSDPGPVTTVSATITSGIAVFSNGQTTAQAATSAGIAQFTVVPVGSTSNQTQTATISFTDLSTCASTAQNNVTVSVTPGTLAVTSPANTPPSLAFAGPNAASQPITVTDYNYAGTISAVLGGCSPTCAIASVTPASAAAPGAANATTFTVQPKALGNATVTLTGSTAQTVKVLVNGASISALGGSPVTFSTGNGTGISGAASSDVTSSAITVSGALQTSGSGSGSVYIGTPDDITSGSGTLAIHSLKYSCTPTGSGTNQGATNLGTIALQANAIAGPCLSFGSNQFSALSFNLNFILNKDAANALPAGTYSTPAGFTLYISAT